ncbi:MAG: hypothetical protein WD135_01385 [Ferruginibacter sp.]
MAQPNIQLIEALRTTAIKLRNGSHYAWGHHGACNCGNLVQVVTDLTEGEILRYAHQGIGEWTELAEEFCPVTKAPIHLVITKLVEVGLNPSDIHHVEYLTDREVLKFLEGGFRWLKRNNREDAIAYFEAFANMLEEKLLQQIDINFELLSQTPVSLVQNELEPA